MTLKDRWKTFLRGFGSVLNIWPSSSPTHFKLRSWEDDAKAMEQDWKMVAQDLNNALEKVKRKYNLK